MAGRHSFAELRAKMSPKARTKARAMVRKLRTGSTVRIRNFSELDQRGERKRRATK